ncbi:MAG: helix-turn-helix transcriptional regulator [Gemmatimonadota bacterium]
MTPPVSLGDLQQLTMLAVARLGRAAFADAVRQELHEVAERNVAVATVHVTLVRLEKQGLVRSTRRAAPEGGRERRYFALTPEGREALAAARRAHERMWRGVAPQ